MTIPELEEALQAARSRIRIPHTYPTAPCEPPKLAVDTDGRYIFIEGEAAAQLALETLPLRIIRDAADFDTYKPSVQVTRAGIRLYEFVCSLQAIVDYMHLSAALLAKLQTALKDEREALERTRSALVEARREAHAAYPFLPDPRTR